VTYKLILDEILHSTRWGIQGHIERFYHLKSPNLIRAPHRKRFISEALCEVDVTVYFWTCWLLLQFWWYG